MGRLDVQFLDEGLHRVLFDAMPLPVFVVDEDVNILEYNAAAARLLDQNMLPGEHRRGGDVLRCLTSSFFPYTLRAHCGYHCSGPKFFGGA